MAYQKIGDTPNVVAPATPSALASGSVWARALPYVVDAVGLYWFLDHTARQMTPPRASRRLTR